MPTWLNRANLYIIGWCIYSTQGILFPKGTLFTQLLLVVLLLASLNNCFIAITRYKLPVYFLGLNLLLLMFFVYGFFLVIGGGNPADYARPVSSFNYLQTILISLLPIYSFYVFFKERWLGERAVYVWTILFIVVATLNYYKFQNEMLIAAILKGSKAEEFTNNIGYMFLSLIPACALLYKKPVFQYAVLIYCMIFILMAVKRGAIVAGFFALAWFMWGNLKVASSKKRCTAIILSLLIFCIGYQFVQKQMDESAFFQRRFESTLEGSSSERDVLYSECWNYFWNETSPMQFLFGSGANATLKVSKNYAHNDWLEIAVNHGIFGVGIYILYWFLFLKTCRSKCYSPQVKLTLQLLFIIYFMKTLFSMSYADVSLPAAFILGYCFAQRKDDCLPPCLRII